MAGSDRDRPRPAGWQARGARIAVEMVVGMVADGWSDARIVAEFPTLTPEDVRACLHYAAAMLREERRFTLPAA